MSRAVSYTHSRTGCVTHINAAFLQEIKECCPDIKPIIAAICENGQQGQDDAEALSAFVEGLQELRDALETRFNLEETYGYITVHGTTYRPFDDRAQQAQLQHKELSIVVQELMEQAEAAEYRGTLSRDVPELLLVMEQVAKRIDDHETLEQQLINDSSR